MKTRKTVVTTTCHCKLLLFGFTFFTCLLTSSLPASSQTFPGYPEFGEFTAAEQTLKQVDFDREASAVIIHHLARTDFDDQYAMITEHRVKIKILNDKGISNGDIRIPFYSKEGFQFINGVEGVVRTFDADGSVKNLTLESKNIFTVKIDKSFSEIRFALPNVKAGSILEYKYVINSKNYSALDDWEFQSDIPTITNYYVLSVIPTAEFAYKVYKLPQYPIEIDNKEPGRIKFKMANLPALKDEAYMDARKDNLQRVTFQLSAYNNSGYKQKYINTWDEAARELLSQSSLGGQLSKSLSGTDDFIKNTKAIADPVEKIKAVYKLVQQKMSGNGYYSKYSADGIKSAWEKGSGNTGEINMIFTDLLKQVGITAYPLMVTNRDHGKIDVAYPFIDQFEKLVTYIVLPEKKMIIDASDDQTPMHIIPLDLLNTYGYKIDKKDFGLMLVEDDKRYYENDILINAEITTDGIMKGNVAAQSIDYARLSRKANYKKTDHAKYLEQYFSQDYSDLKADSLEVSNLDQDSLPLQQQFVFTQTLNTSGDYTFFDYHMFDRLKKNPFTSDMRFSDINFGSPMRYLVTMIVDLPNNYTVDAIPKNNTLRTADTSFSFVRSIQNSDGILTVHMKFEINRSYFEREEYETLKSFYKKLYGLLSEQVVLKKK